MSFYYDPKRKRAKVVLYAGKDHLGRQRQRTVTWPSPNVTQARREWAGKERELQDSIDAKVERGKTVNGLIDEWVALRDAEDSPSTIRKRQGMIRRIRQGLGPIQLADLSALHVDKWMAAMRGEGLTSTTIANHWSCLRAILRQGEWWDLATTRATEKSRPPKRVSNRRPTPPTAAAVRVLIGAARPDLRAAAMLGAYAGLRRGEVLGLRWCDLAGDRIHVRHAIVDLGEGRWHVKEPKSRTDRFVAIDSDLVAALAEHRTDLERRSAEYGATLAPDAYVLPRLMAVRNGRTAPFDPKGSVPRPVGWLTLAWQRHAEKHGAPGVRFHDLRHFFATEQIAAGVRMSRVQGQLGHSKLSTTIDIYTHDPEGEAEAAAEAFRLRRALPSGASAP